MSLSPVVREEWPMFGVIEVEAEDGSMGVLSAPLVKLSALQEGLEAAIPADPSSVRYLLLELSQEEFLVWQGTPLGQIFLLRALGKTLAGGMELVRHEEKTRFFLGRILYSTLLALRAMEEEINGWIRQVE